MSAPVQPVRTDVTLEELEREEAAAKAAGEKPDLTKITLGDDAPEELRGKTVTEAIKMLSGTGAALKVSEQRRLELERDLQQRVAAPAPAAPAPEPAPPKLTKEQLAELYQKDPMQAIEYMEAQAEERILRNVEGRVAPLVTGASTAGERAARAAYPDEFALFGDQIMQFVKNLRDPSAMSAPTAWDDLVSYFRGQPANFDKLMDHRSKKTQETKAASAREAEAAAAGPVMVPSVAAPAAGAKGADGLDDTQRAIATEMGLSPAEYLKWSRT